MYKLTAKKLERQARFKIIEQSQIEREIKNQLAEDGIHVERAHVYGKSGKRKGWSKPIRDSKWPTAEELHWRESVLLRDGYKCVFCGATDQLEADHIKPKALYPDLKLDIDNGRTLCWPCHSQTETYGRKVQNLVSVEVK